MMDVVLIPLPIARTAKPMLPENIFTKIPLFLLCQVPNCIRLWKMAASFAISNKPFENHNKCNEKVTPESYNEFQSRARHKKKKQPHAIAVVVTALVAATMPLIIDAVAAATPTKIACALVKPKKPREHQENQLLDLLHHAVKIMNVGRS